MRPIRTLAAALTAVGLTVSLGACAQIGPLGAKRPAVATTFTFGTAGAPSSFDPFYGSDEDTFRITRQIFETLVAVEPGSTRTRPGLATAWDSDASGKVWTFHLRSGVRFSDGTAFDGTAVCTNFERMFDQDPAGQSAAAYWSAYFGGFRKDVEKDPSLYKSCSASDPTTAVVTIDHPTGRFPAMLSEPAFAMQSPKALTDGAANDIRSVGGGFSYPVNAAHPVGTGPYRLKRYDTVNGRVVLVRNPRYRGEPAKTAKLVFKILPGDSERRQALEAGTIDGYDLPDPVDWAGLRAEGDRVELRRPINLLYLGLNLGHNKLLQDLRVRQAMYYALDRRRLVKEVQPRGARQATQFVPRTVSGFNRSIKPYAYDPAKAKHLLAAAHATKLKITFAYPTDVSRPYLSDPATVYDALKTDLESVGITVKVVSAPWSSYQDAVRAGSYDAYLSGWTGDLDDAYGPLGALFADPARSPLRTTRMPWAPKLAAALQAADATVDPGQREQRYEALGAQIMTKYLPGLPISSSPAAVVLAPGVQGLVASPLEAESFADVTAPAGR